MEAGINFFPDVTPQERPADIYFDECLRMVAQADELGFHHVRIVEHYFHRYGGYSPNPIVFLSAAAQRSRRIKLITGAVLPAFNHPLKLAGESRFDAAVLTLRRLCGSASDSVTC